MATPANPQFAKYADRLADAVQAGSLSAAARGNIEHWLSQSHFSDYWPAIQAHIRASQWQTLEDVFWTTIPFGTAGRRGRMYEFGCNAINERTIGETIQALAEYVNDVYDGPTPATCAIAYDTRHRSDQLAKVCAEIMVAHGFRVYFFEGFRSTPLLATTVRYKTCACGIMVSASHNPPSDNAAKVFWSTGGQLRDPHDAEIIRRMKNITRLKREPFSQAVAEGRIEYVAEEMDRVYCDAVVGEGFGLAQGPRDLQIVYSPLHGVGLTAVPPVLQADRFTSMRVFAPHAEPNGCFPRVPDQVANPENPAVFTDIITEAREVAADLILASDPDADRLGCAAPLRLGCSDWLPLSGNQIAVLIADYVLRKRQESRSLTPEHFIIKTLVTTDMLKSVADHYGVRTIGDCLTGFKWIGSLIDECGADKFVFGAEEAHGYLVGTHVRDKDGAVAAMLMAELAAEAKSEGFSLHEVLERLYRQHGLYRERTLARTLPGADGMREMQAIMARLRATPPRELGGFPVAQLRDHATGRITRADGCQIPLSGPTGDLVILELASPGNYVAVRPSGTEPKIKFYLFTHLPREASQDLDDAGKTLDARLDALQADVLSLAHADD